MSPSRYRYSYGIRGDAIYVIELGLNKVRVRTGRYIGIDVHTVNAFSLAVGGYADGIDWHWTLKQ